uniref:Uncharacterized protein n=1 Tax=Fagus sylvatica TaxID=28930 RepID=A0A2N9J6U8_FAGSY
MASIPLTINSPSLTTSQTPMILLSNISNLVSVKLDQSNYVLWKYQITSILKAYSVLGFVDGSQQCPPQLSTKNEALSLVVRQTTAHGVWSILEKRYTLISRSNILNLKMDLHNIRKETTDSVNTFLQKIKEVRDCLAAVGVQIDNKEILHIVLKGLPHEETEVEAEIALIVAKEEISIITQTEVVTTMLEGLQMEIMDLQGKQPPTKLAAMAATSNPQHSNQTYWLSDTGTIDHFTPDLTTIPDHQDYASGDLATIGNGHALPITHIAVFLINHIPPTRLGQCSPWEKLFHHSPPYDTFRTFGCLCYPLLHPFNTHKLQPRSLECVFLGYATHAKGYICYHPQSRKYYTSRHVIFTENVFPFHKSSPTPASSFAPAWLQSKLYFHECPFTSVFGSGPTVSLPSILGPIPSNIHVSSIPSNVSIPPIDIYIPVEPSITPKTTPIPPEITPTPPITPNTVLDPSPIPPCPPTQTRAKSGIFCMVLKTGPGREPEKGVVPVLVVRPGSDRWSNR